MGKGGGNWRREDFLKVLGRLVEEGRLGNRDGFYFLKERRELVETRRERDRWSKKKWGKVKSMTSFLEGLPWVVGVGVTGSLAMNNARMDDDIDLVILTKRNRLWLVRLLVVLYLSIKGWRRPKGVEGHSGNAVKDRICDNLYLDEEALLQDGSVRMAYEIVQLKPVIDRGGWRRFYAQNALWMKEYLPNWLGKTGAAGKEKFLGGGGTFGGGLNWVLFLLQRAYMEKSRVNEVVGLHEARFYGGRV